MKRKKYFPGWIATPVILILWISFWNWFFNNKADKIGFFKKQLTDWQVFIIFSIAALIIAYISNIWFLRRAKKIKSSVIPKHKNPVKLN